MRILIFSDAITLKGKDQRYYPLRDQYPKFISGLKEHVDLIQLASRCTDIQDDDEPLDAIAIDEQFQFIPLPFYKNTEEFYRRYFYYRKALYPILRDSINQCDVVMVRIHHCLASNIFSIANRLNKPYVAYWAGPPIHKSTLANYPKNTYRHILARAIARFELHKYKQLAKNASWNVVLDAEEYEILGKPHKVEWLAPTLVTEKSIVEEVRTRNPHEKLELIFVGRVVTHKGIFDLLQAIERLVEQGIDIHLNYVGSGPEEARLRQAVSARNLDRVVDVCGNVQFEACQQLLRNAHVFVLPTYAESVPKVLWEAWAAGCAVVTTDVGSITYFAIDNENALVIKPGFAGVIVQAILKLYQNETLRTAIANRGKQLAYEHTHKRAIEKLATVLTKLP